MQNEKKLNYLSAIRFISSFIKGFRLQFVLFYFGWLIETISDVVAPLLFGIMINQIVYYNDMKTFGGVGLSYVTLLLFTGVLYFLIYQIYAYLSNMFTLKVRHRVFRHMQVLDAEHMNDANYGDIVTMIHWQSQNCMDFLVRSVIHNLNNVIRIVFCSLIVLSISPLLAATMAVIVPLSVFVSMRYGKRIRRESDRNRAEYAGYIGWIFEVLSGLRDLRLLGSQGHVARLYDKRHSGMVDTANAGERANLNANNLIACVNTVLQMLLFGVLAYLAAKENITIGMITVVITYFGVLANSVQNMCGRYLESFKTLASVQRIYDFLKLPSFDDRWKGGGAFPMRRGDIRMERVHFTYKDGTEVLKGFSLDVKSGERVALVGMSGSGKTTLANLLMGFYMPEKGRITIDDKPITEYSVKSLRSQIGFVQQQFYIFDATIRENITLGDKSVSEEAVIAACVNAGIYGFIEQLDKGLDTMLGRQGRELSGGQKQRIAIARVYLKNPSVVVFDEVTSALDSESEAQIYRAWDDVLHGKTALIIAHRLSSVMLCGKVALLEDGTVKCVDSLDSMLQNEDFKKLFALN